MTSISMRDKGLDRERCEAVAAIDTSLVPKPEDAYTPESPEVYECSNEFLKLAQRMSASFRHEAEILGHNDLPWMVIDHGFSVYAAGIAKCKSVYQKYLAEQNINGGTEQLTEALRNPKTVRFFTFIAKMTNAENREYESYFNLRGNLGVHDYGEFIFDQDENCFVPEPELYDYVRIEALRAKIGLIADVATSKEDLGVCPALHLIPQVWQKMIDACEAEGLLIVG